MLAFLLRGLLYLQASLPLRWLHRLGAMIGSVFYYIPHNYSQSLKINLDLCLPELDAKQRRQFERDTYRELGKTLFETGAMLLWSPQRLRRLIVEVENQDLLQQALDRGKGVILAVPHLGCWELLGVYLPSFCQLTSLYRPIPIASLDRLIKQARQRAGSNVAPIDGAGIRQLYSALKKNQAIVILPDQDPRLEGQVFAPFFGHLASTPTLLPRLAAKTHASVLFCICERLPATPGYRVIFMAAEEAVSNPDINIAARAMNRDIERCIRRVPTQYQWTYKRFKTRPPGETKLY